MRTNAKHRMNAPALAVALVIPATSNGLGTEWSTALAIPICLLVGIAVGAFNGLLILRFGLSAFIVTLGMLIVLRGVQIGITGGQNLFDLPPSVLYLGNAVWLGLPASIWLCGGLFAAGIAVLGYFRHGRAVYAVGGNVDAARAAGIRTDRVVWVVFMVGGLLAALADILTLAGVSAQWIQAIYGLIILVALMLARLTTGKAQD